MPVAGTGVAQGSRAITIIRLLYGREEAWSLIKRARYARPVWVVAGLASTLPRGTGTAGSRTSVLSRRQGSCAFPAYTAEGIDHVIVIDVLGRLLAGLLARHAVCRSALND